MHTPGHGKSPMFVMLALLFVMIIMIVGGTGYSIVYLEKGLVDLYSLPPKPAEVVFVGDPIHGKELFNKTCFVCHGPTGNGVPPLGANLNRSKFFAARTDAQLVNFVKNGRLPTDRDSVMKGTMPPRGANPSLDDAALFDIVAFVRTLQVAAANGTLPIIAPTVVSIMGVEDAGTDPKLAGEIHYASREGDLEKVKSLLAGKPELASSKDVDGHTPLHWAAWRGHKDICELLLDNKADVNAKDNKGMTALYLSAYGGYKNVAKFLLASNADIAAKDSAGVAALQAAAANGHNDVVKLLLAKNADVNARNNNGETALHSAALKDEKEVAETLLGANADVNAKDSKGQTPLHDAVTSGHKEMADLLRQHGGTE